MIEIGVVSAGYMGAIYARILAQIPDVRVTGLCDRLADKARNLAAALQIDGYAGDDLGEMLRSAPGIQAVVVATPESEHTRPAVAALEAGLDVFVEKPLAMTAAECGQILEAAARRERLVMTGHTTRYDPRFIAARDAVVRGDVGQPVYLFARRNNPSSRLIRLGNRASVLAFLGIHDIDVLLWMVGKPVRSVFARGVRRALAPIGLDDCIVSLLTFDDGTLGVIENAWGAPDLQGQYASIQFTLQGTRGVIEINSREQGFGIFTAESAAYPDMWFKPEPHGQITGMYTEAMADFVRCIRTRQTPWANGADGLEAVRVMEALNRSLAEGCEVAVE